MVAVLEEFIEATESIASAGRLKEAFMSAIAEEGYQNAVFARVQNRRLASVPWSEFPRGYLDTYRAEEWDKIDPIVQRLHGARSPFKWSDTCDRGGFSKEQRNFFAKCQELGVHSGITIPIHGPGTEVDLISVSLRDKGSAPDAKIVHVYGLAVQYWLKYCELVDQKATATVTLTSKEAECLCWCKEGKTNWEIGEILSISEKTVEFHLGNAMRKLGATNRITAVIMGIKRGLITL